MEMIIPIVNPLEFRDALFSQRRMAIFLSATLAVDVFFFLTGFLGVLACQHQLKTSPKGKGITVFMMYLHRILRIWPLYAITIFFTFTIFPKLGNSALFSKLNSAGIPNYCEKYWYLNLLFLNNFVKADENCMGWSWYMTNDFQMYLLIPIICILYAYKRKLGYLTLGFLSLGTIVAQTIILYYYDITMNFAKFSPHFRAEYYIKPYCRIAPFLLGILIAWMYSDYRINKQQSICKTVNAFIASNALCRYAMTIVGIATTSVCVFSVYDFYKPDQNMSMLENVIYIIFGRPGFIIGLMLVIYPAFLGQFSFLQTLLGNDFFSCLSKLTFAAYMFHPMVIVFIMAINEDSVYYKIGKIFITAIEGFVVTYFLSFLLCSFIEMPLTLISKEFLRNRRPPRALKIPNPS
eukprot:TRINITY_DN57735_c0_g1_i2.p1 TRINITY_DN57735_c0_g1~~TRINITY_DN57735_c0_g1_i2.p1  ORF type:complete len:406 (-),score=21.86 TRINITY_DN57735_c0_g1_i2:26-1243(-)